jgi:hypothetical protein
MFTHAAGRVKHARALLQDALLATGDVIIAAGLEETA